MRQEMESEGTQALPEKSRLMSMWVGGCGMSLAFGRGQCHIQVRGWWALIEAAPTLASWGPLPLKGPPHMRHIHWETSLCLAVRNPSILVSDNRRS